MTACKFNNLYSYCSFLGITSFNISTKAHSFIYLQDVSEP